MNTRRLVTLTIASFFAGCATPQRAPLNGFLYTNVKSGGNVTENTVEERRVKACASSLFGAVAWGHASVAGVAGSVGQLSIVDGDDLGVLGVYARHCTVMQAGTSEIALTDEPEEPSPPPPAQSGAPRVVYRTDGSAPAPGASPPTAAPEGGGAPKPSWGATPAPDAPTVAAPPSWPGSVAIADRTACTLVCMENDVATESAQVEVVIEKQLGALRACALRTLEFHSFSSAITFGPDGRMTMTVNMTGLKPQMRECASHIPAPGYFRGPPRSRWKCTDYCR